MLNKITNLEEAIELNKIIIFSCIGKLDEFPKEYKVAVENAVTETIESLPGFDKVLMLEIYKRFPETLLWKLQLCFSLVEPEDFKFMDPIFRYKYQDIQLRIRKTFNQKIMNFSAKKLGEIVKKLLDPNGVGNIEIHDLSGMTPDKQIEYMKETASKELQREEIIRDFDIEEKVEDKTWSAYHKHNPISSLFINNGYDFSNS